MKIDLESPTYYRGLGDIVMLSWLSGAARASDPLRFHRTRNLDLMRLLRLDVDPEPGGISLDPVFQIELADHGRQPRLSYIKNFLELPGPLARPLMHIDAADAAWADSVMAEMGSRCVLIFPQSLWKTREWPASYWIDLAWKLRKNDVPTITLLDREDERFLNTPNFRWGTPFSRLAALMQRAKLVVGNDSFPAHLAGTVGTRTVALMGPTRASVFAHMPNVDCLASNGLDCTGCHFREPFRAACDQGCMSLYRLFPDDVLRHVLERI